MKKFKRSAGILLHISSLPNEYGIGTIGKEAYEFIDFLKNIDQKLWQICQIGPTGYGDSPYQCFSAFAGNPYFIDLMDLVDLKLLTENRLPKKVVKDSKIDYGSLYNERFVVLRQAFLEFLMTNEEKITIEYNKFKNENKIWLKDYSLFMSLKKFFNGKSWHEWKSPIKLREKEEISKYEKLLNNEIEFHNFIQFMFFRQWEKLKIYANKNNVEIIGDMPIYIASDSADAWANSEIFMFDKDKKPLKIAGVPPDYFSATGQLWGNPVYNWTYLEKTNFKWWVNRCKEALKLFDYIRIDHFRGFSEFWAVNNGEKTAENGKWLPAKGKKLFAKLKKELGNLPIIAEDLGVITKDVEELRDEFQFPGMRILQFAFNSKSPAKNYLPHSYIKNTIAYTGTHDNQTTISWYNDISEEDKDFVRRYLGCSGDEIVYDLIRAAMSSTAIISIIPMQDFLMIDDIGRMNTPSVAHGNWTWRFKLEDIPENMIKFYKDIVQLYDR